MIALRRNLPWLIEETRSLVDIMDKILRTRKVLGFGLLAITLIFAQQNFSWVNGLYGVGIQDNLAIPGIINYPNNVAVYLVKAKNIDDHLEFTYRFSSNDYFKIPLWPFCVTTIIKLDKPNNLIQIENLSTCDLHKVKILHQGNVDLFLDLISLVFALGIVFGWLLLSSRTKSNNSNDRLLEPRKNVYY